jgi:hypothetical protein
VQHDAAERLIAARHALREDQHVGTTSMRERTIAGAAEARDHLVDDEQQVVPVAERARARGQPGGGTTTPPTPGSARR